MAKGENIFRRRDGRWEARYSKGRELSGKIKYGYCYGKTYREAKEKAEKCKAALANGNPLPTSRIQNLFSAYCTQPVSVNFVQLETLLAKDDCGFSEVTDLFFCADAHIAPPMHKK